MTKILLLSRCWLFVGELYSDIIEAIRKDLLVWI